LGSAFHIEHYLPSADDDGHFGSQDHLLTHSLADKAQPLSILRYHSLSRFRGYGDGDDYNYIQLDCGKHRRPLLHKHNLALDRNLLNCKVCHLYTLYQQLGFRVVHNLVLHAILKESQTGRSLGQTA